MDERKRNLMKKAMAKLSEVDPAVNHNDWKLFTDDKKEQVLIRVRADGAYNGVIGSGALDYCSADVFRMIGNGAYRKTYDDSYEKGELMERVGPNTFIGHDYFKGLGFVSGRDFYMLIHSNISESGVIKIIVQSIEDESLCPQERKYVRGHLELALWMIEPLEENKCKLTYISFADFKGSLPSSIVKMVNKD